VRKTKQRILRAYRRHAMKTHDCDRCCGVIEAGEMYEGVVEITSEGRLRVSKQHVEPSCDWPTEPNDEDRETHHAQNPLARAA
jgi:hypothetical protein